jgi:hypothetical protein
MAILCLALFLFALVYQLFFVMHFPTLCTHRNTTLPTHHKNDAHTINRRRSWIGLLTKNPKIPARVKLQVGALFSAGGAGLALSTERQGCAQLNMQPHHIVDTSPT